MPAERLVAFSDAVVAISITLLVLPLLELVDDAIRSDEGAVEVVTRNLVPFGTFLLSFVVIWRIWSVHHQVFAGVPAVTTRVSFVNMLWLACIVVLPFAVDLVGAFGAEPFVLALYFGALLLSCAALTIMALLLSRQGVIESLAGNAVCPAIAFVVVIVFPGAGFWPLLLLLVDGPVLAALRAAGVSRRWRTSGPGGARRRSGGRSTQSPLLRSGPGRPVRRL